MALSPGYLEPEVIRQIDMLRENGVSWLEIATQLGIPRRTLNQQYDRTKAATGGGAAVGKPSRVFTEDKDRGEASLELKTSKPVKTLADAIRVAEVDESIWYVHGWECRMWTVALNIKAGQERVTLKKRTRSGETVEEEVLRQAPSELAQQQQYLVSLKLRRKTPDVLSIEALLEEIKKGKVKLPAYKRSSRSRASRRALEISICDPHLGLRCHQPHADAPWNLDIARQVFMETVERLLRQAEAYGPFHQIVMPIGNDYFHADTPHHTTTKGTPQPDMDELTEVWLHGEKLMLWYTERMREAGPLNIYCIAGNHANVSEFFMGRLVSAYYQGAKAKDVTVDASSAPYKFWAFGPTLIGFDHGHSVNPIRLAALMANECRTNHWQNARYCEWHCADQHRKGSAVPVTFEEQGVSVEYLQALTPANAWHKGKGLNWQKRGGVAFIYDEEAGPVARLQCNFDSYTGKIMGAG